MKKFVCSVPLLLIFCSVSLLGQVAQDQWLRAVTGEGYVTDVDRTSLVVGPGSMITANFRTVFVKPEQLGGRSNSRFRTRLDSIQFRTADRSYRVINSIYLGQDGHSILQTTTPNPTWKQSVGVTSSRLYSAASQLSPFGRWKVLTYHYASGAGPANDDPSELRDLVGSTILLEARYLVIGSSNCTDVIFDARSASDDAVSHLLGTSLKTLEMETPVATIMRFDCRGNDKYPRGIYVFPQSRSRAKLLWNGVFLDIERPPNPFLP